jgi:hypothetical protein
VSMATSPPTTATPTMRAGLAFMIAFAGVIREDSLPAIAENHLFDAPPQGRVEKNIAQTHCNHSVECKISTEGSYQSKLFQHWFDIKIYIALKK